MIIYEILFKKIQQQKGYYRRTWCWKRTVTWTIMSTWTQTWFDKTRLVAITFCDTIITFRHPIGLEGKI